MSAVNYVLDTSDTLEHLLSELGAQINYVLTGDLHSYNHLTTCKLPGASDLLPSWAVSQARDQSKALFQQQQRAPGPKSSSAGNPEAVRRISAKAKSKPKAKPKA